MTGLKENGKNRTNWQEKAESRKLKAESRMLKAVDMLVVRQQCRIW